MINRAQVYTEITDEDEEAISAYISGQTPFIVEKSSTQLKRALRSGKERSECSACFLVFVDTFDFDKHRIGSAEAGTRRCMPVDEMSSNRFWKQNKRGEWRYSRKSRKEQSA